MQQLLNSCVRWCKAVDCGNNEYHNVVSVAAKYVDFKLRAGNKVRMSICH